MKKNILPPDWNDHDLRLTAIHEAGHALVAEHYNLRWLFKLTQIENTTNHLFWMGEIHYAATLPYRVCVLSFAGPMAEYLAGHPISDCGEQRCLEVEDFDLSNSSASEEDLEGINSAPKNLRRRAMKQAWKLVVTQRTTLMQIAARL